MRQTDITERKAFLREVYKHTPTNTIQAVPYEHIAAALTFHEDVIAQACSDLQGMGMILVHSSVFTFEFIPPEGCTGGQASSTPVKLVTLTDEGLSYARQHCQS